MRRLLLIPLLSLLVASELLALPENLESKLRFESGESGGKPEGWGGGPPDTIFYESEIVKAGDGAARITRDGKSAGGFSSLTDSFPIDFAGKEIELRGFLRTRGVTGFTGLWLRLDGRAGMLQFDNMQNRGLKGETEWTEYSIRLPLDEKAVSVNYGVLLSSPGEVWADELRFFVDGKPIVEAPELVREKTILDTDQEFTDGSKITLQKVSEAQIENLAILAQVWGFVKYHHPAIAAGERQWDFDLFRVMPLILGATDAAERDLLLAGWLGELGEPEVCDPCVESPEEPYFETRLAWQEGLSPRLAKRLRTIYERRASTPEHFYVTSEPYVQNPNFGRELAYAHLSSPDAGFRLLSLFRVWNIIEYFFPYRDLIDGDWSEVLREFIPRLVAAESAEDYQLELLQAIAKIRDGHSNLWSADRLRPPHGECHWPIGIRFIEDRAMVLALAPAISEDAEKVNEKSSQPFEIGDVIRRVDGKTVEDLVELWTPFYPGSNRPSQLRGMGRNLTRGACGPVKVEIDRGGEIKTFEAERLPEIGPTRFPHDRPGESFQRLSDEVAYLKLTGVKGAEVPQYLDGAAGSQGLIIDIRNYPSDFMVFALGRHLIDEVSPFARFTVADYQNPGTFTWTEPLNLMPAEPSYLGKVVILVDEASVSSSEYTAMAFRANPRAVVVGSTTAGADGNVSRIPLPGGLRTGISGIGVFYPDKSPTQRIGILPDIAASPTVKGLRDGRDEVLEAAIRHILGPEADGEKIRSLAARPSGVEAEK